MSKHLTWKWSIVDSECRLGGRSARGCVSWNFEPIISRLQLVGFKGKSKTFHQWNLVTFKTYSSYQLTVCSDWRKIADICQTCKNRVQKTALVCAHLKIYVPHLISKLKVQLSLHMEAQKIISTTLCDCLISRCLFHWFTLPNPPPPSQHGLSLQTVINRQQLVFEIQPRS